MEIIILEKTNGSYIPFDLSTLDRFQLYATLDLDDNTSVSEYIDSNYTPKQCQHNYNTWLAPSAHCYSVIITQDDKLLYFISSTHHEYGRFKSMLRQQRIGDIIK